LLENPPARSLSTAKPSGLGQVLAVVGLAVAASLLVVMTGGVLGPQRWAAANAWPSAQPHPWRP
jgi:hypothetical protein